MLRKSTCSGDSTYRRSSLRACLREARSMIHRLLQMLDKVLRNAHEAYLCELAQNVAITIEEIVNGHALMSGQIPIRLVTRARQTPHCCLASRKPLLLSSEVADGGFLRLVHGVLGVADSARALWHGISSGTGGLTAHPTVTSSRLFRDLRCSPSGYRSGLSC